MSEKRDSLTLDDAAQKAMAERLASAECKTSSKSLKKFIQDIYPQIRSAIEDKGLKRIDIYNIMLDDEQRKLISPATFMGYYHAARKAHLDAESRNRRNSKPKGLPKANSLEDVTDKLGGNISVSNARKIMKENHAEKTDSGNIEISNDIG